MTYKEALDKLDKTFIGDLELKIVVSKALEKQIQKKPKKFLNARFCGSCGNGLHQTYYTHCQWCGQAIDWSKKI